MDYHIFVLGFDDDNRKILERTEALRGGSCRRIPALVRRESGSPFSRSCQEHIPRKLV